VTGIGVKCSVPVIASNEEAITVPDELLFAPIAGLRCDTMALPVELSPETVILRGPQGEPMWRISFPKSDRPVSEHFETVSARVERDLGCLRLFGFDSVYAQLLLEQVLGQEKLQIVGASPKVVLGPAMVVDCYLSMGDVPRLKKFCQKCQLVNVEDLRITRFTWAPYRRLVLERIIDYIIALELIYGDTVSGGQYRFKVPCRCAGVLAADEADANAIYDTVDEGYRVRNSYMHGGSPSGGDALVSLGSELRKLTRHSICFFEIGRFGDVAKRTPLWRDIACRGPVYQWSPEWLKGYDDFREQQGAAQLAGFPPRCKPDVVG
jgi:hypothetical protein